MRSKRRISALAKRLASSSFDAQGALDVSKIRALAGLILEFSERDRGSLLRKYAYFLGEAYRQRTVRIECAGDCNTEAIHRSLETTYRRPLELIVQENPELIAGVRVTLGDHIWERSVRSDLIAMRS
ncbi:MAG: F0F1 ATP synthase subunit delta [Verrucomicrobiota bacterium]|nr:MAG: F0F1 ATP synthase subunit delta [Verrucomicrobiota bacterium]